MSVRRKRRVSAIAESELRLVQTIEGEPRPTLGAIAQAMGLGKASAWRALKRLEARGAISWATAVNPNVVLGACECLAYLEVSLEARDAVADLEAQLKADAAVVEAAVLSGRFDYVLRAYHRDEPAAHAWFKALVRHAAVRGGELKLCRTLARHAAYARAILNSTGRPVG